MILFLLKPPKPNLEMKYEIVTESGLKKGVLFLSGRSQPLDSWNVINTGKIIDLEKHFRKQGITYRVEFEQQEEENYDRVKRGEVFEDTSMYQLI